MQTYKLTDLKQHAVLNSQVPSIYSPTPLGICPHHHFSFHNTLIFFGLARKCKSSKLPPLAWKKLMKRLSLFIQSMAFDFNFRCWNIEKKIGPTYT